MFLVQGSDEISVLPAVIRVFLHYSSMDTGTVFSVVSTG